MKAAFIYSKEEPKLAPESFFQGERDMLLALIARFDEVQGIFDNCSAEDIEADVIFFWDPNSTHNIVIDGLKNHKAIKYSFLCDLHQPTEQVMDKFGRFHQKHDIKWRCQRELQRETDYFIVTGKEPYFRHLAPHYGKEVEDRLVYFPWALKKQLDGDLPLYKRKPRVLASGSQWSGTKDFRPYEFRRWACKQDYVDYRINSYVNKKSNTPDGQDWFDFLTQFAGGLAACDECVVAKYMEIPMAGCVCFAQHHKEYEDLGFKHNENVIFVDKNNFEGKVKNFIKNPGVYQEIADAGKKLVLENYTSGHFSDYIYQHAKNKIGIYV